MLVAGDNHNQNHQESEPDENESLEILGRQSCGFSSFVFDCLFHKTSPIYSSGSCLVSLPVERHSLFPDDQIAAVDDLGNDVDAAFMVEIDQVRFAVFDLVDSSAFRWQRT